jgi:hypothetical protein
LLGVVFVGEQEPATELQRFPLTEAFWKGAPQRVKVPYVAVANSPCNNYPSRVGHVEPGLKLGGPSPKAKYSWATDSAKVARAKDEKQAC